MNIWLTVITLLMFLLSSAHMAMTFQYANSAYLQTSTNSEGSAENPLVLQVPALLEIVNVSLVKSISSHLLADLSAVSYSRRCCALASVGSMGKNLSVSCDSVVSVAGERG